MLWGAHHGGLELRTEGGETRLRATFPYGRETVLWDGGGVSKPRKEVIAPRAFARRIAAGEDIHLLSAHDYAKPLASRQAGTLTLTDGPDALVIEARIGASLAAVSYVADFLAAHAAGLVRGLSPGFRVAPDGETVEARGGAILRTIKAADLFEVSAVTVPAYPEAQIEARNWQAGRDAPDAGLARTLARWRA
jgi:uncharacterized protein